MGCDAVDWFRGRVNLFDPVGIIGLLGVHFFFTAPLLHVVWNSWMLYIDPPPDWRDWLGCMAIVNAIGLVLYRCAKTRAAAWKPSAAEETFWQLSRDRFLVAAGCGLVVSGVLQIGVYAQYGGITGFVEAYSESIGLYPGSGALENTGWIFTLSESFPILAIIYFAVFSDRPRSLPAISLVLLGFFVLQMLFGGLRGSRSTTIWALFWAAGILHFWTRPLDRKFVFVGLAFVMVFMYLYGFYKELGQDAVVAVQKGAKTSELSEKTGRTFDVLLLGDLARADVQAFLLYRLTKPDRDYQYAWGRTYLGTAAILVPKFFWPARPPTKVKEGTDAQFGTGSWDYDKWSSSLVYGLAGETMLNFGPIPVPFAYGIFGFAVGILQRSLYTLRRRDTRLLLYPFFVNLCFSVLQGDSDNLLFNLIKGGAVPMLVIWLGSHVSTYSKVEEYDTPAATVLTGACPLEVR